MNDVKNRVLTPIAKTLRKRMTKEEKHLWYDFLKKLPITVHRQKVIGKYIVDFYCAQASLVIEIDGSQHYDKEGKNADEIREDFLAQQGLTVVRYSNLDIQRRFDAVCRDILKRLELFELL